MSKKINQHYVPQFNFRLFSTDKRSICLITKDKGKLIRHAAIKGQASKNNFYGHKDIENALSDLEAIFSVAIREVLFIGTFDRLPIETHLLILQSIMLQRTRTQSARNNAQDANDTMLRMYLEVEINTNENLTESVKAELRKSLEFISAAPENFQAIAMSQSAVIAEHLMDLQPVLMINKTTRPLIFGDAPAVFCNPLKHDIDYMGVIGAKSFGLIIYYPLSSHIGILLVDQLAYNLKGIRNTVLKLRSLKDVASLNKLQIHNASKAVYFTDMKYANYVSELWYQVKNLMIDNYGAIREHETIEIDNGCSSQIIQFYERQIPDKLELTFLSINNYLNADESPLYRQIR